jgi:hypothetical protein
MPRSPFARASIPIAAALSVATFATGLAPAAARAEGCGKSSACTIAEDHGFRAARDSGGRVTACAITLHARDIDGDQVLTVTLVGGEGAVLPYMRYMAFVTRLTAADEVKRLPLAAIRILAPDLSFDTEKWHGFAGADGVAHVRADILHEDRAEFGRAAARATRGLHALWATFADGTRRLFGITTLGERNDVAEKFAACMETLRRDVGG